jgi:hypothetical protein
MGILAGAAMVSCAGPGEPMETPPAMAAPPVAIIEPADADSPALRDGAFPPDFAIDATVMLGRGAADLNSIQDRPTKYVLLPDGSLHADESPFVDVSTRPGRSRWLYEDQVQYLWSMCRDLGFTDADAANGPPNPDLLRPARGERMAVLTLRGDGRTWTFVRRAVGKEEADAAITRVLRTLAILAWLPDRRPEEALPERYDFGPDPYAVYRQIRELRRMGIRP